MFAGAIAPYAKVIAFEPHPFWFEQLERNVTINNFQNIRVEKLGIGEITGTVPVYIDNQHLSASSMMKEFTGSEHVTEIITDITSIDSFVKQNKLERTSLSKIDIKIYESAVLSGGKTVLQNYRPDIICGVLPDEGMSYREINRMAIQEIITQFGYQTYWISEVGLVREEFIQGHYPFSNYLYTNHQE